MVRLSEAEARRAGLVAPKSRTTRKAAPRAGAVSVCAACGERFATDAAETEHLNETGHGRYESELEVQG